MAFMFAKGKTEKTAESRRYWKVLVVDDEPAVHDVTRLALGDMSFDQRGLQLLSAYSGAQAREMLAEHADIALILLDVVMETDDAGLRVVDHLRKELGNREIRVILRTGHPGQAPERTVIDRYDINDYKEKTELTSTRLYSVVRTSLQAYQHLRTLAGHKQALEFMALQAPKLFHLTTLHNFFHNLLDVVEALLPMLVGDNPVECNAFIAYPIDQFGDFKVHLGKGRLADRRDFAEEIVKRAIARQRDEPGSLVFPEGYILPIRDRNNTRAIIFIEQKDPFNDYEKRLLDILAMEAMITFRNIDLYDLLACERNETIDMLAVAAEFKDETTGEHVKRVETLTRLLALELDFSEEDAAHLGRASVLHDIGKLAIADAILNKTEKLQEGEFDLVKKHTIKGYTLLEGRSAFDLERTIAITHHERYDGKGYPHGLAGEDIPVAGRIVALSDVYDALANPRPYKDAWPIERIHQYIEENRGKQFDPVVVDAFFRLVEKKRV